MFLYTLSSKTRREKRITMNKIIAFVVLLSAFVTMQGQQKNVSLTESISLGLKNSKVANIANAQRKMASAKKNEIDGGFYPQLKLTAGYTRLSEVDPFAVSLPFAPAPIVIQDAILDNYQVKLSLSQPLFTGFKLSSLSNAAERNIDTAEAYFNKILNDEAFSITKAYWNVYKLQQAVALLKKNIEVIQKNLADSRKFYATGLLQKNDVLKLEVREANITLKLLEAQNTLAIARADFNRLLSYPLSTEVTVSEIKASTAPSQIPDFSVALTEAFTNREEIKIFSNKIAAAEYLVDAASSGYYPSVSLNANYTYANPNSRIMPLSKEFNGTWDVGIGLSWELWNWGTTSAQAEQSLLVKEISKTSFENIEEMIRLEVYSDYLTFTTARQRIKVAELAVKQSEENFQIISEKYNVQLVTGTDLIDAENSLYTSKIEYETALADLKISEAKFFKSLGRKLY